MVAALWLWLVREGEEREKRERKNEVLCCAGCLFWREGVQRFEWLAPNHRQVQNYRNNIACLSVIVLQLGRCQ